MVGTSKIYFSTDIISPSILDLAMSCVKHSNFFYPVKQRSATFLAQDPIKNPGIQSRPIKPHAPPPTPHNHLCQLPCIHK